MQKQKTAAYDKVAENKNIFYTDKEEIMGLLDKLSAGSEIGDVLDMAKKEIAGLEKSGKLPEDMKELAGLIKNANVATVMAQIPNAQKYSAVVEKNQGLFSKELIAKVSSLAKKFS